MQPMVSAKKEELDASDSEDALLLELGVLGTFRRPSLILALRRFLIRAAGGTS